MIQTSVQKAVVDIATGIATEAESAQVNPASELGRMGGLKDGMARARALSPERWREIARRTAVVRWGKSDS